MADNTPVVDPATSEPKAELQPEATKEEVEIPKFAKSLDETEEVASEPEAVETPVLPEEEQVVDRRLSKAIDEVKKRNEEVRRHVELQAEFVRENNELIHKIAASDPRLANQIVEKVWGVTGIKSYKQLLERSKLEELKTSDPDNYETKRKLWEMENRLATAEQKEQKHVRNKFFSDKGISDNEYDPNFRKINEALETLNPSLVLEDYGKALNLAYAIAFSEGKPVSKQIEIPIISVGGGKKPAPLPTARVQHSDQTSWLADSLNKKLGYKINLNS